LFVNLISDSKWVEIYEGDIMKNPDWIQSRVKIVEFKQWINIADNEDYWSNNLCWFCFYDPVETMINYKYTHLDSYKEMEVIGNIYENPDLLSKD